MTFVKGSTVLSGQVIMMTMAPAMNARITEMIGRPSAAPNLRIHAGTFDAGGRCSDVPGCFADTAMQTPPLWGRFRDDVLARKLFLYHNISNEKKQALSPQGARFFVNHISRSLLAPAALKE